MPLVRISFRAGKPTQYRQAVADEVHRAMVEAASVPELDRFQVLTEHGPAAGEKSRREAWGCAHFIGSRRPRGLVVRRRQSAVR